MGKTGAAAELRKRIKDSGLVGITKAGFKEAGQEAGQEGLETYLGNVGAASGGATIDPLSGVGEAIGQAGVMSFAPGAGAHGLAGYKARQELKRMGGQTDLVDDLLSGQAPQSPAGTPPFSTGKNSTTGIGYSAPDGSLGWTPDVLSGNTGSMSGQGTQGFDPSAAIADAASNGGKLGGRIADNNLRFLDSAWRTGGEAAVRELAQQSNTVGVAARRFIDALDQSRATQALQGNGQLLGLPSPEGDTDILLSGPDGIAPASKRYMQSARARNAEIWKQQQETGLTPDVIQAQTDRTNSQAAQETTGQDNQRAAVSGANSGAGNNAGQLGNVGADGQSLKHVVLQNRDREGAASVAQMQNIAAGPDYNRVSISRQLGEGAPVVLDEVNLPETQRGREEVAVDGQGRSIRTRYAVVEAGDLLASHTADGQAVKGYERGQNGKMRAVAGNGRVAGIQRAYTNGAALQYRTDMQNDQLHGIDPQVIAGMKNPVLVRTMSPADVTEDIGDRTNTSGVSQLSPVEQAKNDARRIDVTALEFDDNGDPTAGSVRQFVQSMPQSEQSNLMDSNGQYGRQAVDRLMAAVFWKAYGDADLVQLYAQATDPEAKTVLNGLAEAAGPMAQLAGTAVDIRDVVADAAKAAVNAKRKGLKLADYASTQDITIGADSQVVIDFFAQNIRSAKRIGEGLRAAAQFALDNQGGSDMFGNVAPASRSEILSKLGGKNDTRTTQNTTDTGRGEPAQVDAGRDGKPDGQDRQRTGTSIEADTGQGQGPGTEAVTGKPNQPAKAGFFTPETQEKDDGAQADKAKQTEEKRQEEADATAVKGRFEYLQVPSSTVEWMGFEGKKSVKADWQALAERHSEYYASAQQVRSDVKFVLEKPDGWYIHKDSRVVLFRERVGTGSIPQSRVEIEADADSMMVRSVYIGGKRQIAKKMGDKRRLLDDLGLGGQYPDSLSIAEYLRALSSGSSRPASSSDETPKADTSLSQSAPNAQGPEAVPAEKLTPITAAKKAKAERESKSSAPEALTSPTPDGIRAIEAAKEAAAKAEKAAKAADDARAKLEQERKDIAQRSEAAADTFELGQDPMANLTGQGGLFDGPATGKLYDPALDPENIRKMAEGASKQTERDAKNRAEFEAGAAEREANRQAIGQPEWVDFEGVQVLRIKDSNFVAVPVSGKRLSAKFDIIDTTKRNDIVTQLTGKEVRPWLVRQATAQDEKSTGDGTTMNTADASNRGDTTRPDTSAKQILQQPKDSSKPTKIEDSGEVLEGARKLYAKSYAAKLDEGAGMETASVPLSKSWPEPDYQRLIEEGADPWAVAFARAVRDEIPTKPMKGWKLKGWVQKVEGLRGMAQDAMSGKLTKAQMTGEAGKFELKDWLNKIDLYEAVGHANSLKTLRFSEGEYGMYGGQVFKPAKKLWTVNAPSNSVSATWSNGSWGNDLVAADTKAEAIEKFKAWIAEQEGKEQDKPASKRTEFDVYRYRNNPGVWIVGKRISATKSIDLKEFASSKEAQQFIKDNQAELETMLADAKVEQPERREANEARIGGDHRNGADVTTEQFREAFGFRGEQFGASMPQDERQANMNQAYDALMDLAGVLGVPSKALSLNGELGLAFGARGTGGKRPVAAHYEADTTGAVTPNRVVINLTRKNGAGSLAHEWFHAVDNYFARMRGEKAGFLTQSYSAKREGVRPEMVEAFQKLMGAITMSGIRERSKNLDKKRTKDYWSTGLEMAARSFESYIIAKLQDKSGSNDYLANIVPESMWQMQDSYPYPTMGELPAIRTAFDNFFATVKTKETDKGVAMFSRSPATQQTYEARIDALFSGEKAKTGTKILDSSDVMGLLGYPKLPLVLNERHLIDGLTTHSEVTAEAWKRVPQWLENPAAVYKSLDEKNPQRVVLLAPELLSEKPVLMVIEPNPGVVGDRKGKPSEEQLLVTVFAKTTGYVPLGNAARQGKLLYMQKEMAPAISSSEGVQFPRHGHLPTGHTKILTEKNLAGYRKAQNPAMSLGFGRGIEVETAQGVVDGITSRWANAPEIVVVSNLQDAKVPERVRLYDAEQRSQGATGEPEGFFYEGKVYIVADQLDLPEDVIRVLFHETLGHAGLRGVFGDALDSVLRQVVLSRRALVVAKAKQYGLDIKDHSQLMQAAEEVLAEKAQENPSLGFVQRAIAAIRTWLRANVPTFKDMDLSDDEIVRNFLEPARAFVERGPGGRAKGGVSFSRGTLSTMPSFDNASGNFNPDLDKDWIKLGQKEINGDHMSDAEYNTAVAEYANSWRIDELLEKMGWRRSGSSNVSASFYFQKTIELDEENENGDDTLTYEVRISDHDDRHRADPTVEKRFQVNFRSGTARWSDLDISPDMSTEDALFSLGDLLKIDPSAPVSGGAMFSRQVDDQTQTEAFRKWFGDSKVVDADGKPLVVYHGNDNDIQSFDPAMLGTNTSATSAKKGFFFAGHPRTTYAYMANGVTGTDATFIHLYGMSRQELRKRGEKWLSENGLPEYAIQEYIENVLDVQRSDKINAKKRRLTELTGRKRIGFMLEPAKVLTDAEKSEADSLRDWLDEFNAVSQMISNNPSGSSDTSDYDENEFQEHWDKLFGWRKAGANIMPVYLSIKNPAIFDDRNQGYREQTYSERINIAIAEGHDGVIIRNTQDGFQKSDDIYIVFRPEQIKSAIGNNGDFDGTKPEIRFSRRSTDDAMDFTRDGHVDPESLISAYKGGGAAGVQAQLDSNWTHAKNWLTDKWADSMAPAKRWAESLNVPDKIKRGIVSGLYRGAVKRDALQHEAKQLHGDKILKGISNIAKKNGLDVETAQRLVGYWLTSNYAPKANAYLIQKDRNVLSQANIDLVDANQNFKNATQALAAINNPNTKAGFEVMKKVEAAQRAMVAATKARDEAYADLQKRIDSVNNTMARSPKLTRGVAGGLTNLQAGLMKANIEARIDPADIHKVASEVYKLMKWKLALDIKEGRVDPATVAKWPQHADYVPLTGSPYTSIDEDVFGTGSNVPNVSKDKALGGRTDSVADDGIAAVWREIAKSATHAGFQDFKGARFPRACGIGLEESASADFLNRLPRLCGISPNPARVCHRNETAWPHRSQTRVHFVIADCCSQTLAMPAASPESRTARNQALR